MVIAMARDIRVLVIKLADRLHNMRTLRWMPEDKQQSKARETLEIYAPLAHRLGMNAVKWELEDLSFATLYPKMYEEIVRLVGQRAPSRDQYLATVIDIIEADLKKSKVKAIVTGRPKHYYSVYQKMIVRGRDFADIYDLVGVRILVEDIRDCYAVLGIVHAKWSPVPGRFKDFIAMPKFNMYQSLHTTVIGPEGKPVELQIRTQDMHRSAEFGVAAHWRYKQQDVGGKTGPDDFGWLRQLLEWQRETEDPDEFLDALRYDLGSSEVFVFTPKGDVVALPSKATPVDFAYSVHTEVGHRCVGARVNGKLVPLESSLENGDVVEIFTSKADGAGPSRDWLRLRPVAAGADEDQGVVLQGAARGGDRDRQGLDRPGHAQAGPAAAAHDDEPGADHDRRRPPSGGHHLAVRLGGRGPHLGGDHRAAAGRLGRRSRRRGRRRGRGRQPDHACSGTVSGRPATSGSRSRALMTCGSSWPAAARPYPATTSSASSPAGRASRCTGRTA